MSDNTDSLLSQHGGNVSYIRRHFPNAPQPFVDLSTGINPYRYPFKQAGEHHRLADVAEMDAAMKAAAAYYGVAPENVTLGAGMQPLMLALACLRLQKCGVSKIAILSPTYSEYKKIWQAAGHEVIEVATIDELAGADVAILCNPNNPDGKIYSPQELLSLENNWLIVDEAFADTIPHPSPLPEGEGMIRMRSVGKFFGLAGLRVSCAIADRQITNWLRVVAGAWPIATDACLMLPDMFQDESWIEHNRKRLVQESADFREVLVKYFTVVGYTSLFTLVKTNRAEYWYEKFAENGILVRKFDYNEQWLRFGLPDKKHIERIERTLYIISSTLEYGKHSQQTAGL